MLKFKNPQNGYTIETQPGLATFLFGPLYFMKHGAWGHVFISFILAMITIGLSWLVYPFFAGRVIRDHYLKKGWTEL